MYIIDLNNKESVFPILSISPIYSSIESFFKSCNVRFDRYQMPSYEVIEHITKQHMILVSYFPITLLRKLNGKSKYESINLADVVFNPAGSTHYCTWDSPVSFLTILLEPIFVLERWHELVNPDKIEFLPSFSKQDLIISGIANYLNSILNGVVETSSYIYMDSLFCFLSKHLIENYSINKHLINCDTTELSSQQIEIIIAYIDANYFDLNIRLNNLSTLLNMSDGYFSKIFKKSTGFSPRLYLLKTRMSHARRMLSQTQIPISDIARLTGFSSPQRFATVFRANNKNTTPCEFRLLTTKHGKLIY